MIIFLLIWYLLIICQGISPGYSEGTFSVFESSTATCYSVFNA